jgi:hypothetical protein
VTSNKNIESDVTSTVCCGKALCAWVGCCEGQPRLVLAQV